MVLNTTCLKASILEFFLALYSSIVSYWVFYSKQVTAEHVTHKGFSSSALYVNSSCAVDNWMFWTIFFCYKCKMKDNYGQKWTPCENDDNDDTPPRLLPVSVLPVILCPSRIRHVPVTYRLSEETTDVPHKYQATNLWLIQHV